jgi:hypothetical protein
MQMALQQYFEDQHVQGSGQKISFRFVCSHRLSDYIADTSLPGFLAWSKSIFVGTYHIRALL